MYRLLATKPEDAVAKSLIRRDDGIATEDIGKAAIEEVIKSFKTWADKKEYAGISKLADDFYHIAQAGTLRILPGPTGERNSYELLARQDILCLANNEQDLLVQLAAVLSVGAIALWSDEYAKLRSQLPEKYNSMLNLLLIGKSLRAIMMQCFIMVIVIN